MPFSAVSSEALKYFWENPPRPHKISKRLMFREKSRSKEHAELCEQESVSCKAFRTAEVLIERAHIVKEIRVRIIRDGEHRSERACLRNKRSRGGIFKVRSGERLCTGNAPEYLAAHQRDSCKAIILEVVTEL